MEENKISAAHINADACIHCHLCREACSFLRKYGLDIGDTEQLRKLAYHCFLCGKCTEVCPKGIDGRQVILQMRQQQVRENGGRVKEKGYAMLIREKKDYLFQNYRNGTAGSVFFPGCNFPSYYPETTRKLAAMLRERAGIGIVFDCCGKPVAELGMEPEAEKIIETIDKKLRQMQVEEVIMACPNCYAYLKGKLSVRVVTIYTKLLELGLGKKIGGKLKVFPPCPDRAGKEILSQILPFLEEDPEITEESQCCGLGGCAGQKEPELAGQMIGNLSADNGICTYCASCSGNFARKGYGEAEHILLKILESSEKPDAGKSMINRMKTRYWQEE